MATLPELAARLRTLGDVPKAIRDCAQEIAAAAVADTQERMALGLQPDGTPQPPVQPRRSGNTGPPLVDYGDLRESVTATVEGTVLRISATGPGANRHQRERPFLGMSPELAEDIGQLIAAKIAETATPSGV